MKINNKIIGLFAGLFYVAMIVVNFLANSLPINNRSTGDISGAYPNLFTPVGLTFSIWGLIYIFLAGYLIYQIVPLNKSRGIKEGSFFRRVNILFLATSIANMSWIFSWHYDFIGLSVIIMILLLILLVKISDIIFREKINQSGKFWISLPFSLYFGWISVATIANVTVFLVSINWKGFNIPDFIWTILILFIGVIIGIWRMKKDKSIAYGLVFAWAYFGILLKHVSATGFHGEYPSIIATLLICLSLLILFVGRLIFNKVDFNSH